MMRNFSFFEVEEKETKNVIKALSKCRFANRKLVVEVAGDEHEEGGKKGGRASFGGGRTGNRKGNAPADTQKKKKPSREERGYTKARGKKDDWKQFFQQDGDSDFKEEGWARRKSKK